MLKKAILSIFILMSSTSLIAQVDLSQYVINSWGSYFENSSISVSASVGEAMIPTVKTANSSLWLTQGFQQPDYVFPD